MGVFGNLDYLRLDYFFTYKKTTMSLKMRELNGDQCFVLFNGKLCNLKQKGWIIGLLYQIR